MNREELKELRWAAYIQAAAGIIGANMPMFGFYTNELVLSEPEEAPSLSDEDVAQRVLSLAGAELVLSEPEEAPSPSDEDVAQRVLSLAGALRVLDSSLEYPASNVESSKTRSVGWHK